MRFLIKTKEIDESDGLKLKMTDLAVEDFGLKNNSIIFYEKKKIRKINFEKIISLIILIILIVIY